MDPKRFSPDAPGRFVPLISRPGMSFLPDPLPPKKLNLHPSVFRANETAAAYVGRLASAGEYLENPHLLMRPLIRRDAIDSSAIEGTITTAQKLLLFEAFGDREPGSQEREVGNYVEALNHGIALIEDRPLSLNALLDMHRILMRGVRGQSKKPGEFRTEPAWIGDGKSDLLEDARYVPPPRAEMTAALSAFEKSIHAERRSLPDLVWLAMLHYQFEAIHPFMDGNGRLGRLMIPLLLCSWQHLPPGLPLLYVSPYFRRNKEQYEDLLLAVSEQGAWAEWVTFFLKAIAAEAASAWVRARKLRELRDAYHRRFGSGVGKIPIAAIDLLFFSPIVQVKDIGEKATVSAQSAGRYVNRLVNEGVLVQLDENRKWGRTFAATEILEMIYGDLPGEPSVT